MYLNESDQAVGKKGSFPHCQGPDKSFQTFASQNSAEQVAKKAGAMPSQKYLKPSLFPGEESQWSLMPFRAEINDRIIYV